MAEAIRGAWVEGRREMSAAGCRDRGSGKRGADLEAAIAAEARWLEAAQKLEQAQT